MNDRFLPTVKWLHIELTTRCNAWCSSCNRNIDGYKLVDGLVEKDLSLIKLKKIISDLPNLKTVQLCGGFGDPIAAKNISEVLDFLIVSNFEIRIHTNGSLKSKDWWSDLGKKLKNIPHSIFFGIDGLEDTHKIYRQNTDFNKIIQNAQSFIQEGGKAAWQFIPFLHNEHQIFEAYKLSKKIGFYQFILQKKPHVNLNAKNFKTGELLNIKPWSKTNEFNQKVTSHYKLGKSCMHLEYPSLYINASGIISFCCFLSASNIEYDKNIDIEKELQTNPRIECKNSCNF